MYDEDNVEESHSSKSTSREDSEDDMYDEEDE